MSDRAKDAALVHSMAAGDKDQALAAFYARFAGLVMALLVRILKRPAEAEELLQEVFLELWRRAPQYDPKRAAVSTWVMTIARSRALDLLRAKKRRHADKQVPSEDAVLPAPSKDRPDELAAASQRSKAVREALGKLSDVQREVLELSYYGGYSHSEIATKLDIPLGTVKSRILAAMRVLRIEMHALENGGQS